MLKRRIVVPPRYLFPGDDWAIVEAQFSPEYHRQTETLFALSNGYVGVRGTLDEGRPVVQPGTFVNGFHETWTIHHPEQAYGLATTGQTIVSVPDATTMQLYVDDEPLFLPVARYQAYRRVLDMREGTLRRELVWSTPAGKHVRVTSTRLVSLEHRHLVAISYEVTLLDHPAPVTISSGLVNIQDAPAGARSSSSPSIDPRLARVFDHKVLCEEARHEDEHRLLLGYRTANSHMTLGLGVDHLIESDCDVDTSVEPVEDGGALQITAEARPGTPIRVVKYAAYHTSRSAPVTELMSRSRRTLDRAKKQGFDALVAAQRGHLAQFWHRADVRIDDAGTVARLQQAVRWNLFQLAQASWRAEGSGIPAKGLTSQTYEGHYFWDSEVYVLPFLTYTWPRIARNLLRFRYSMLDAARSRAAMMNLRGALFPWRTINGEEASAYYQAGTAQYHINADIAYAIRRYVDVRGDSGFLVEVGAEMLIETARLWVDLGFYDGLGRFRIDGVTGPDEYTTVVNDNTYTNLMARLNLNQAATVVRRLEAADPDSYAALCHRCGLRPGEVEAWERAAAHMYVPYSEERRIHPQDDDFLDREVWDLDATPAEKFPLLLHFHPLVIYRYQVLKQADVVLAMFLLGNEFSTDQKRRNFEYYDPLTTGDSSLSAGVESIIAAEVGEEAKALEYFAYSLLIDLAEEPDKFSDGVHIASAAGTWMALVFGFGGVRDFDGHLTFDPHLPDGWRTLAFPLRFQDRQLQITLGHDDERYLLEEGDPIEVTIRGKPTVLVPGSPEIVPLGRREHLQGAGD